MPEPTLYTTTRSPLGELLIAGSENAVRGIWMQDGARPRAPDPSWVTADAPFATVRTQLDEYFAGERRRFELELELEPAGTRFQLRVWRELSEIPYGSTVAYGELARRLGHSSAARAVGAANAVNPISIVVPCHRVVGAAGALTGYAGGIDRKRLLLELEAGGLSGARG